MAEFNSLTGHRPASSSRAHRNGGEAKTPLAALPGWTAEDLRSVLRTYNRAPFQDILGAWLEYAPTPDSIYAFAQMYPDRWAAAVSHLARVAGFSERREVLTATFNVSSLSDSQLEDRIIAMANYMGVPPLNLLDAVQAVMIEGSTSDPSPSDVEQVSPIRRMTSTDLQNDQSVGS